MPAPDVPGLPSRAELAAALRAERPALVRLAARIQQAAAAGRPFDRNLARLHEQLARSSELRRLRAQNLPRPTYPDELPVSAFRGRILDALASHPVVVIAGETGSGKSTQLPKMLLEAGCGIDGMVGITQPRRIAASSLARRVAEELGSPLGQDVGFQVRFTDETSPRTYCKFMTDGILLAETRRDRRLLRYDALIVDEAHERSLNVDFLLGYLRRLLERRTDLKVIVTSATLETERFAAFFDVGGRQAPVIEVTGRSYPVEIRYAPPGGDGEGEPAPPRATEPAEDRAGATPRAGNGGAADEVDEPRAVADAVEQLLSEQRGDVLVFLPTEKAIVDTARVLRGRHLSRGGRAVEVLPLYARLPSAAQRRIFEPGEARRVVLATNVAESSVTVPRIGAVVDTGTARIARYLPRARIQRLPIEPVSQASAAQRAGRCGRLGPGIAVRLYSREDFEAREPHTTPEIQRSNLAAVVLRMKDLSLGRVEDFPFLDPPRKAAVAEGERTLAELSAVDALGELTEVGRTLARLPVDPRLGRVLLAAHEQGCLAEALIVVAALETRDPRERPEGREKAADAAHAAYADPDSDVAGLLKLWDAVTALRESSPSRSAFDRSCRQRFLSPARCREWADVRRQLQRLVEEIGLRPGRRRDDRGALTRALLAGFLCNVAKRGKRSEYTGAEGKTLSLWPGSALFERRPKWIVATEVVETGRRYARNAARVDPADVEALAGHLVQRTWRDPYWDQEAGEVLGFEQVSLFGLLLVPSRRGYYAPVDPVVARELFLRHALVEGAAHRSAPFLEHNLSLANDIAALEAKTRRRGLLADLDVRYDFYDRIVPPEVTGSKSFHRWRRRIERSDPGLLFMTRDDLLAGSADGGEASFPDELVMQGKAFPLRYRFAPGEEDDGVSMLVHREDLGSVDGRRTEWLVPGLLREKVTALIRSLPKDVRRLFVPVPAVAAEVMGELRFGQGDLLAAVARACQRIAGEPIAVEAFDPGALPDHLRLRIAVLAEDGQPLASGRDLPALRRSLGAGLQAQGDALADPAWNKDGLTAWSFGPLPERVVLRHGGRALVAFPALLDKGDSVSLRLRARRREAERQTRAGVERLIVLSEGTRLRHKAQRHRRWQEAALASALLGGGEQLAEQVARLVARRAYLLDVPLPREAQAFADALDFGGAKAEAVLLDVIDRAADVLSAHQRLRAALDDAATGPLAGTPALAEVAAHASRLVPPDVLLVTPWEWLPELPRFLAALERRLQRMRLRGTAKDAELAERLRPHEDALARLLQQCGPDEPPAALQTLRWMVEELAVSLFAQELGTSAKVSGKRLLALREEAEDALAALGAEAEALAG